MKILHGLDDVSCGIVFTRLDITRACSSQLSSLIVSSLFSSSVDKNALPRISPAAYLTVIIFWAPLDVVFVADEDANAVQALSSLFL